MNSEVLNFIEKLLSQPCIDEHNLDFVPWLHEQLVNISTDENTVLTALNGGMNANDLSEAFAIGYQAAIHFLQSGLSSEKIFALCVTEEKGGSPKVMEARLDNIEGRLVLSGAKSFVSMGDKAEELLVLAVSGSSAGHKQFSLVQVSSGLNGVKFIPFEKELPFVPRMPHARVEFDNVQIADGMLSQGEGYLDYVVHFRPIEDIHVFSAVVGYLWKICRNYEWSLSFQERLISIITGLVNYRFSKPVPPSVDLINAGMFSQLHSLLETFQSEWEKVDKEVSDNWHRDIALLNIAGAVREKRKEKAWSSFKEVNE